MVFNSVVYFAFLVVVLAGYHALAPRQQVWFLLVASYFFYGWWDWRFLSLMLLSTVVDYAAARLIESSADPRRKWAVLLLSMTANLGLLGFFKYYNFFVGSAAVVLDGLGIRYTPAVLEIVLPVGISFYTFQTMSYTIDVYRGRIAAARDFWTFALYVSFFPQLVAGPIERADRLLPQLERPRVVTAAQVVEGCWLILVGLVQKVGIADAVAVWVDEAFQDPTALTGAALIGALYLFALQIYCDFAGYSSIARGSSKLLGVELMINFRQPYLAHNITDFWRRWHISLSEWLRDYLYIPLGGSRGGEWRTYRNLALTMLIGGLWHGASWTFVVWGGLHGLYLSLHKAWRGEARKAGPRTDGLRSRLATFGATFLTLQLVVFAWLFFRAESLGEAWLYLASIAMNPFFGTIFANHVWIAVGVYGLASFALDALQARTRVDAPMARWPWQVQGLVAGTALVFILVMGGLDTNVPFIYFQF